MSRILDRASDAKPANDLAADCSASASSATACNSVAAGRIFVGCVNDVIDESGEKKQAIASESGYSEFQFSRIRSCQSGSLDFPDRLPEHMQRDIARRYAEAHGFDVRERTREEDLQRQAELLHKATKLVQELTAAHLRTQMRGRR